MNRVIAVLLIIAASSFSSVAQSDVEFSTLIQAETVKFDDDQDCWFDLSYEERDGRTITCRKLIVPENWDKPEGNKIHLPVVRFGGKTPNASEHPIIYILGGPNQRASLRTKGQIRGWMNRLKRQRWSDRHDVIVLTLRGSNWTDSNIECPELIDPRVLFGGSGQRSSIVDWRETYFPAYKACAERLKQAHDLAGLNPRQTMLDIVAVRDLFELQNYSLLGVSFGTYIALNMMRSHPKGIDSVVLDSVFPPNAPWPHDFIEILDRSLRLVFDACAADARCSKAFGNIDDLLKSSIERLRQGKLTYRTGNNDRYGTVHFDANPLSLFFMLQLLLYDPTDIESVPHLLDNFANGKGNELGKKLREYFEDPVPVALPAFDITTCSQFAEDIASVDWEDMKERFPLYQEYLIDYRDQLGCDFWNDVKSEKKVSKEPVASDIPTLLLSGAFDPVTPPSYADLAAEHLSRSFSFVFENQSHSLNSRSACAAAVTTAFLRNPRQEPAIDCSLMDQPLTFRLRN